MGKSATVKVLHIIARLNIGGPAIYVILLTHELPRDRFHSQIVTGTIGRDEGDMSYLALEKGIHPLLIPGFGREISFLDDLKVLRRIANLLQQLKPDIVHTHTAKAGTIGRLSALLYNFGKGRRNRIRLIHTFHGHVFHSYFGFFKTRVFILIESILGRFTDRIIVLNALQKEDICHRFKIAPSRKVVTIPCGIDLGPFSRFNLSQRAKARRDLFQVQSSAAILVGIVGRLTGVKNHHLFLDMVKTFKGLGHPGQVRFVIVGDGELRKDLEEYAARNQVREDIIFAGWQKDMPSVYHACDIVTLTSKNEGSPFSLIEAMASRKPVITTDVGGVGSLFGPVKESRADGFTLAENGILVPSGDRQSLARALQFLILNPETSRRLAQNAQDFVLKTYSKERLIKDMDKLYSELMAAKHPHEKKIITLKP